MTNAKHTPGPWRIGDAGNTVFGPKTDSPSPITVASIGATSRDLETKRANARLIAAGPELLAAAQLASALIESNAAYISGEQWAVDAAIKNRAAIKKATQP